MGNASKGLVRYRLNGKLWQNQTAFLCYNVFQKGLLATLGRGTPSQRRGTGVIHGALTRRSDCGTRGVDMLRGGTKGGAETLGTQGAAVEKGGGDVQTRRYRMLTGRRPGGGQPAPRAATAPTPGEA